MASVFDAEILNQLKCSTCGLYLSVSPVTQISTGFNCGRCASENEQINTIFELVVKNRLFPCQYDVKGCEAVLPFGEPIARHEEKCKYEKRFCPLTNVCDWQGTVMTSYQHCLEQHPDSILEMPTLTVNWKTPIYTRKIIKGKRGELFLLHVQYNEEMGLSVVLAWWRKKYEGVHYYTLVLKSSAEKDAKEIKDRKIYSFTDIQKVVETNWVPNNILKFPQLKEVTVCVQIEPEENEDKCDVCNKNLTMYIFCCRSDHYLCSACGETEKTCKICKTVLQIKSNYDLMKTKPDHTFFCRNGIFGCNFLYTLESLQNHERTCAVYDCLVKNCLFKGVRNSHENHIRSKHTIIQNKENQIILKIGNDNDVIHFLSEMQLAPVQSGRMNPAFNIPTTVVPGFFAIQILENECTNTLELTVNNLLSSFYTGNNIWVSEVTIGENFAVYSCNVHNINNDFTVNCSKSIHISRLLLRQHKDQIQIKIKRR